MRAHDIIIYAGVSQGELGQVRADVSQRRAWASSGEKAIKV